MENIQNNLINSVQSSQPVNENGSLGNTGSDFLSILISEFARTISNPPASSYWDWINGYNSMLLQLQTLYPDHFDAATVMDITKLETYVQNKDNAGMSSVINDLTKNHDGFSKPLTEEEVGQGLYQLINLAVNNGAQGIFNGTSLGAAMGFLDLVVSNVSYADKYRDAYYKIEDDLSGWKCGTPVPVQFTNDFETNFAPYYLGSIIKDTKNQLAKYAIDGDSASANAFEADIATIKTFLANAGISAEAKTALQNMLNYEGQQIDSQINDRDSVPSDEVVEFNNLADLAENALN